MTVLLLAPAVPPPMGGLERLAEELHRHVSGLRAIRMVATSGHEHARPGVSIVRSGRSCLLDALVPARFAAVALSQVLRNDTELVHALTWKSALPVLCVPRSQRPLLVVHCLGAELLRSPRWAWLRNRVLLAADALVAVSHHTAEMVQGMCGREPTVIPPGIDLGRFRTITRSDLPSDGSEGAAPVRVLSVGRLEPRKGHAELVRAVAVANAGGANCHLTILGRGPERGRLEAQVDSLVCRDLVEILPDADDARLARGARARHRCSRCSAETCRTTSRGSASPTSRRPPPVCPSSPAMRRVSGRDPGRGQRPRHPERARRGRRARRAGDQPVPATRHGCCGTSRSPSGSRGRGWCRSSTPCTTVCSRRPADR